MLIVQSPSITIFLEYSVPNDFNKTTSKMCLKCRRMFKARTLYEESCWTGQCICILYATIPMFLNITYTLLTNCLILINIINLTRKEEIVTGAT